jgi:hypothetical protein
MLLLPKRMQHMLVFCQSIVYSLPICSTVSLAFNHLVEIFFRPFRTYSFYFLFQIPLLDLVKRPVLAAQEGHQLVIVK